MSGSKIIDDLFASIDFTKHHFPDDVAHIEVHHNQVLGAHLVPGFEVDAKETKNGLEAKILTRKGAKIAKPVHICFGMLPEKGLQEIILDIETEEDSAVEIIAHCTFPNAVDIEHRMDAKIKVGRNSSYAYFERHVHGDHGGVHIIPKSIVTIGEGARFKSEFELIKGSCGRIDLDLDTVCGERALADITARIRGRGDDRVKINESTRLEGDYSRGVLTSHIALQNRSEAEVLNTIIATGSHARGHVDCKEVVLHEAVARAVPIVEVRNPKAHVTHEAAVGSVDNKQLQTLMARGLNEDEASDLIIQGLLA